MLDCTYKTNRYNQPLLNIAGVNGCNKTVTLGVALLATGENKAAFTTLLKDLKEILGKPEEHQRLHCGRAWLMQVLMLF